MPDRSNILTLLSNLQQTPSTELAERELEICMLKFGSYVSMLKNKSLNATSMIVETIKDRSLQQDFCEYFSCENFSVGLALIFTYNPLLIKSKAIKDSIKTWMNHGIKKR